jgi:hypothetical protein
MPGENATLNVLVNGTEIFPITKLAGEGVASLFWQKYTTTIVAASSETTIALMNGDVPNASTAMGWTESR